MCMENHVPDVISADYPTRRKLKSIDRPTYHNIEVAVMAFKCSASIMWKSH